MADDGEPLPEHPADGFPAYVSLTVDLHSPEGCRPLGELRGVMPPGSNAVSMALVLCYTLIDELNAMVRGTSDAVGGDPGRLN